MNKGYYLMDADTTELIKEALNIGLSLAKRKSVILEENIEKAISEMEDKTVFFTGAENKPITKKAFHNSNNWAEL